MEALAGVLIPLEADQDGHDLRPKVLDVRCYIFYNFIVKPIPDPYSGLADKFKLDGFEGPYCIQLCFFFLGILLVEEVLDIYKVSLPLQSYPSFTCNNGELFQG